MCVHIHPIMIKIHPVFFFLIPVLKSPFSNQAVLRFLSEWYSSVQTPPTIVDWQDRFTLDPPRVSWELSASGAGEDKMSQIKWLRCLVVGCNNEYSRRHLLPTSEPLKTQRINVTFILKWMHRSPIYINVSMFARIIRDPASSTEVTIRFFMNLCKLPFLIMCLLDSFVAEVYSTAHHPTEERGGVRRAH